MYTHPEPALPHELTDKLGMAVRREAKGTATTIPTGTQAVQL